MQYGVCSFFYSKKSTFSWLHRTLFGAALCCLSFLALAGVGVSPSGAATYSIGITVPPGVAGVEPKLTLNYSSQSGTGLLGYGWSLGGLSAISRCPKTFLQDSFDRPILDANGSGSATTADATSNTTDAFCLDGQRLIKVDGYPGRAAGEYRLEREGYSRIRYDGSVNQWTVETKSGNMMIYGGGTTASPSGANGNTRAWLVTTISDTKNNAVTFTYEQGNFSSSISSDRRITNITYGPNGRNVVFFYYEATPRNDPQTGWLNGVQNVNDKRLRMIQVVANDASNTSVEVRRYLLTYPSSPTALTNRDTLSQIQECVPVAGQGANVKGNYSTNNTTSQKCLPSQKFTYYSNGSMAVSSTSLTGPAFTDAAGYSSSNDSTFYSSFQFPDINGDGLPDVCFWDNITSSNHGLTCYIATKDSNGVLSWPSVPTPWNITAFTTASNFASLQFIDVDSNGTLDVCARFSDGVRCYKNNGAGFDSTPFVTGPFTDTWVSQQSYDSDAGTVTFLDLNNDGYADVCGRGVTGLQCFLNNQNGGFSSGYTITGLNNSRTIQAYLTGNADGPLQTYSTLRYADVNGDGYVDVCAFLLNGDFTYANGTLNLYCWLNKKDGTFTDTTATGLKYGSGLTSLPLGVADIYGNKPFNIAPGTFVDVNLDGRPDYCLRTSAGMECWINEQDANGNPKMVKATISGITHQFSSVQGWDPEQFSSTIQFVDLNGDSRPDFCGRAGAGLYCFLNMPTNNSLALNFQELNDTQSFSRYLTNSDTFNTPSMYKSFRFFTLPNGRTALFARYPTGNSKIYTTGALDGTEANDLLTSVVAGNTPSVNIKYGNGAINYLYSKGSTASTVTKPDLKAFDLPAPMPLVSQITMTPSDGFAAMVTSYQYSGLVVQQKRGLLGFGKVISTTSPSGDWVQTTYRLDWPFVGLADTTLTGNTNLATLPTRPLSQTVNRYFAVDLSNSANTITNTSSNAPTVTNGCLAITPKTTSAQASQGRYLIYPYEVEQDTYSPDTAYQQLGQVLTDTIMETSQGNVSCVSVKTRDKLDTTKVWEKVTNNTYDTSSAWTAESSTQTYSASDLWVLGRLTSSSVMTKAPASAFTTTPTLGSSQGGYSQVPFKPNDTMGSEAPVYPDIAAWFIAVTLPLR